MQKIKILPYFKFIELMQQLDLNDENIESKDVAIISIHDVTNTNHYFNNKHKNVLNVEFNDWDREDTISENCCNTIIHFLCDVEKYSNLIVHCTMGVSRSGAVGSFASDMYGLNFNELKKENPQIVPNSCVYNKLRKCLENK